MDFAHSETAQAIRLVLGSVLRARREAARRTLSEIAAEAGLSPAHLSEVERGRKEVSGGDLRRACAAARCRARPARVA
ncbi:MAG: helix-turn-helix transcriptional regulator [Chloroflexi bacterium]|nr:MAG: helix-turn-helix transcriptional regulator [Chloroflexota bacterium]